MTVWWKLYTRDEFVAKLYVKQKGRCAGCRDRFGKRGLTLDHNKPRACGGTDDTWNMQLYCFPCNRKKSDRDPLLFYRDMGYLL